MPTGRVKWFDPERGFGFLSRDDGGDVEGGRQVGGAEEQREDRHGDHDQADPEHDDAEADPGIARQA